MPSKGWAQFSSLFPRQILNNVHTLPGHIVDTSPLAKNCHGAHPNKDGHVEHRVFQICLIQPGRIVCLIVFHELSINIEVDRDAA